MTIEELWKNLKPIVNNIHNKVSNLEDKVENLEPLLGKVEKLEPIVEEIKAMKEYMREIQHVNMTSLIKGQIEIKQELKVAEERLTQRMDQYLQKDEVEHKKFEYEIANLEWKMKS